MTHTYCAFGKCSTCSMLHSLHKCEISSKFSNLLHFTNKITHLRIHRTENAMRNYYNYVFSHTTRVVQHIDYTTIRIREHDFFLTLENKLTLLLLLPFILSFVPILYQRICLLFKNILNFVCWKLIFIYLKNVGISLRIT